MRNFILFWGLFFLQTIKNSATIKIAEMPIKSGFFGAPRGTLTPNTWFRRPVLYTVELVEQNSNFFMGTT